MARIKLGDIFEIKTAKGYAYLHFVFKDKETGDLVRVLSGLHKERPTKFDDLVGQQEQFMVFFPLSVANRKKIVECVGNHPVNGFDKPKFMRTEHYVRGELLGWHIVNTSTWDRQLIEKLTPEQKKLSPWGVWNDTLLIENLEANWNLELWG